MPLYFHSSSGRTASSKMKKLGVKMRPEMLLHTKQTRPELHAASPLKAELHILRSEKSTGPIFVKTRYLSDFVLRGIKGVRGWDINAGGSRGEASETGGLTM